MPYDNMTMLDSYDNPLYINHVMLVENFMSTQDFRFLIVNSTSNIVMKMSGNFVALFGFDPSKTMIIPPNGVDVDVQIPIYGHDYICVSSNIGSNSLSSTCGERLETTNLLAVMPTPNFPAQLESYSPPCSTKTETSSNIINTIELHFTDKLFQVRKHIAERMRDLTIQDMNKKLRMSNNK